MRGLFRGTQVGHADDQRRFQEALCKAFAGRDQRERLAYFDLATFYHRRLGREAQLHPPADMLSRFVKPEKDAA